MRRRYLWNKGDSLYRNFINGQSGIYRLASGSMAFCTDVYDVVVLDNVNFLRRKCCVFDKDNG